MVRYLHVFPQALTDGQSRSQATAWTMQCACLRFASHMLACSPQRAAVPDVAFQILPKVEPRTGGGPTKRSPWSVMLASTGAGSSSRCGPYAMRSLPGSLFKICRQ